MVTGVVGSVGGVSRDPCPLRCPTQRQIQSGTTGPLQDPTLPDPFLCPFKVFRPVPVGRCVMSRCSTGAGGTWVVPR